jgi:hypothetical protein
MTLIDIEHVENMEKNGARYFSGQYIGANQKFTQHKRFNLNSSESGSLFYYKIWNVPVLPESTPQVISN